LTEEQSSDALPSLRESALPNFRESALPNFRESDFSSIRESTFPSIRESTLPSFRESALPSLRESALPSLRESALPSPQGSSIASLRHPASGFRGPPPRDFSEATSSAQDFRAKSAVQPPRSQSQPFVFFEKFLSADELRNEAEAKRKLDAEFDAR
jgi:hypothetical protein